MKYYVAEFAMNYADEFYVRGLSLFTEQEYNSLQDTMEKYKAIPDLANDTSFYKSIGSNDDLEATPLEFFESISFKEITEEEFNIINKCIGCDFGMCTPREVKEKLEETLKGYLV